MATDYDCWQCPNCGYDTTTYDVPPEDIEPPVKYSQVRQGYDGYESWTEYWICPDCGTEFEVENGT